MWKSTPFQIIFLLPHAFTDPFQQSLLKSLSFLAFTDPFQHSLSNSFPSSLSQICSSRSSTPFQILFLLPLTFTDLFQPFQHSLSTPFPFYFQLILQHSHVNFNSFSFCSLQQQLASSQPSRHYSSFVFVCYKMVITKKEVLWEDERGANSSILCVFRWGGCVWVISCTGLQSLMKRRQVPNPKNGKWTFWIIFQKKQTSSRLEITHSHAHTTQTNHSVKVWMRKGK